MVKEKAYAKINLFLNVMKKRIDGFHDLEMVMASLDFYDILTFKNNKSKDIVIISDVEVSKKLEDNTIYKIAKFLKEEFKIDKGVTINLTKNIPISAGLGGGSADAAATFRGLNKLWKLELSFKEMASLSSDFGSDIPFCIYNKLAIARGKGEDLGFIDNKIKANVILINPNIEISTKEVFEKVDISKIQNHKISGMTSAIYNKNYKLLFTELHNSLEQITFEIEPKIREIKNKLIDLGLDGALMSGSGATVFGLSRSKSKVKEVIESIEDNYFKILTTIR